MESLQSRRILLCDRFGLSTDREFGRVKKMIPRERLMRSVWVALFKKKKRLYYRLKYFHSFFFFLPDRPTARDGAMGNETFYGDGLRIIKGTN